MLRPSEHCRERDAQLDNIRKEGAGNEGTEGELALATGGAGGIGQAITSRLAGEGCVIGILDINGDAAKQACVTLKASGAAAFPVQADICNYPSVSAVINAFVAEQGRDIDMLVDQALPKHILPTTCLL